MKYTRLISIAISVALISSILIGCAKSTPPGANSVGGVVDEVTYSYHYWNEGLAILVWHDSSAGSAGCGGSGSTEDPVYRLECTVQPLNGTPFEWTVHTSDGVTADMWLGGESIDLSQGNMLVIRSGPEGIRFDQYERDFSKLEPTNEALASLIESDQVLVDFLEEAKSAASSPQSGGLSGLSGLMEQLRSAGVSVVEGDQIDQPFFSIPGQILIVNGEDVQVFEYLDSEAAENEAAMISPSGSSIGTTMVTWVSKPHFYLHDQFIVLYVGENDEITSGLQQVLGEPIAEGQGSLLPPPIDSESSGPQHLDADIVGLLPNALVDGDYDAVESFMADSFTVGYWQS